MSLRIRGLSHSSISDALRGVDLKSKLDVILPLLGISTQACVRQLALESQGVRSASVHFKAHPEVWTDNDTRKGDHDTVRTKAKEFLNRNSVDDIERLLASFVYRCLSQCPEFREACELLRRFRPKP